jgi:NAD(P)-dependent dehydrogenase (short-subunit alcohol dehydrogenase family)
VSLTSTPSRVAVITGATQGLGLALAEGLARRLDAGDTVYLTGRNPERITEAIDSLGSTVAEVRGEVLDVSLPDASARLATELNRRHGGVDIVINNAVMRVGPDDDPAAIVDEYSEVNNFGTTRCLRALTPLLRSGGRFLVIASSLGTLNYLAPVLWERFDGAQSLDDVDEQVGIWRDAVKDGSARGGAWPGFVNIPSKIGQVVAVRALAARRRESDIANDVLLAAVCPGMMNTPTSSVWWDVSSAPTPAEAAVAVLDLIFDPVNPGFYGELVRDGQVLPWKPPL